MKLSVIIPVYNSKEYLYNCVNTILIQKGDFEIILIDDGSTDGSSLICDDLSIQSNKVISIHKINEGVSSARNYGINRARGDYLVFVDSDDLVSSDYIKVIEDNIQYESLDFIVFGYKIYNSQRLYTISSNMTFINGKQFLEKCIKEKKFVRSVWHTVYKKNVIQRNMIYFNNEYSIGEDFDFNLRFFEVSERGKCNNFPIYNYRIDNYNSVTKVMNYKNIKSQMIFQIRAFYKYQNDNELLLKKYFACQFANSCSLIFNIIEDNNIQELVGIINKNKLILKYTTGIKYYFARIIWNMFGYYRGSLYLSKINPKKRFRIK